MKMKQKTIVAAYYTCQFS